MKIFNKIIISVLCFLGVFTLIQSQNVQASELKDYKIISDCKVTPEQAKQWAKDRNASDTFIELADLYWKYSEECGNVNPAIAYVQAAKETGYGKF